MHARVPVPTPNYPFLDSLRGGVLRSSRVRRSPKSTGVRRQQTRASLASHRGGSQYVRSSVPLKAALTPVGDVDDAEPAVEDGSVRVLRCARQVRGLEIV